MLEKETTAKDHASVVSASLKRLFRGYFGSVGDVLQKPATLPVVIDKATLITTPNEWP